MLARYQEINKILRYNGGKTVEELFQASYPLFYAIGERDNNTFWSIFNSDPARYVVENYGRTPVVPEDLVIMAKAYRILEMEDLAKDAVRVLKLNYPNHPGIYQVEEELEIN